MGRGERREGGRRANGKSRNRRIKMREGEILLRVGEKEQEEGKGKGGTGCENK